MPFNLSGPYELWAWWAPKGGAAGFPVPALGTVGSCGGFFGEASGSLKTPSLNGGGHESMWVRWKGPAMFTGQRGNGRLTLAGEEVLYNSRS